MNLVQIISNVRGRMGKAAIQTLAPQDALTAQAVAAFDFLYPHILSTGFWRFATAILQLNELNVTIPGPPGVWTYAYALPQDYLKTVRQYPHNYAWEVYTGHVILSRVAPPIYLEYVYLAPIELAPPYFIAYLIDVISNYLALSNAQKVDYATFLTTSSAALRDIAMAADSQNRPQSPLVSAPMLGNRFIGTWTGGPGGGAPW